MLICSRCFVSRPRVLPLIAVALLISAALMQTGSATAAETFNSKDFEGLEFRGLGPAFASGRIGDIAVDPRNPSHYYVAVCSGGVWETHNAGVTFEPIFDDEGSYSIGCLAIAPSQPNTVWVGTGENNSQRSVSYGDGVYKSIDGGKNWENMGLERSLHVGKILVHPCDADVVYVAAMGPLWGPGGDRGLYKTTDGGQTWKLVLAIDEDTGVVDLAMDPRDPDVIYAASYQRRRHVWTLINGGPGSGIHKTTDGGQTWTELTAGSAWTKLTGGRPRVDLGRIGLAVSPANPDIVYAIVEAAQDKSGFFRSTDQGLNWSKMDGYVAGSPQYYNEIIADPVDPDRVYSMDTFMMVTENGGKDWGRVGWKGKHVDEHALWIDPTNTDHILTGNDGGLYETYDRGENWRFMTNLPVTQFYKVAVDYDEPFYNVYGGTQDNNTQGGPSRTIFSHGISNREWFMTLGGDGFEPAIDPTNPDIVYSQWQYGNLHRYDRQSGEILDIQPQPEEGEVLKWNWDSPLIISPHDHQRLYYACQKVFCSEDMGYSWTRISKDLTRGIDRNRLEVMGRVWSVDAVAKNNSTSNYGSIVSLAESPVAEGVLYAGTDDGLIQVSRDGGVIWTKIESFKGAPDGCYVSDVEPSQHKASVVFACLDNHKQDDFRPYLLRSDNHGHNWSSISGDLPERGNVYSVVQDHVDPALLFVGTEFGVFFTRDGGNHWVQLDEGIPVSACRDLEIQRRENDLVVATFGRGFYVLDDYTPLRNLTPADLEIPAKIFPVREGLMFQVAAPLGYRDEGFQGASFYTAANPPYGAVITYHLAKDLQNLEKIRREVEKKKFEEGQPVYYPSWEELRAEDREHDPAIILSITDPQGKVVRRLTGPTKKGFHRVAWDFHYPPTDPVELAQGGPRAPWDDPPLGPLAIPGTYQVSLAKRERGVDTPLAGPAAFQIRPLQLNTTQTADFEAFTAFQQEAATLSRAVQGAARTAGEASTKLDHIRQAILDTPTLATGLIGEVDALETRLADLEITLNGDRTISGRSEPTTPGIRQRVGRVMYGISTNTSGPTQTQRDNLTLSAKLFKPWLAELKVLVTKDLHNLEQRLEAAGAPYTPGRFPVWSGD